MAVENVNHGILTDGLGQSFVFGYRAIDEYHLIGAPRNLKIGCRVLIRQGVLRGVIRLGRYGL